MRLNNATIKQVIVSPATLGERLRLCGIRPYNEYIDGNRTDTVLGYTYTVTCSGFQGERLDVKIPGKQLLGEDAYDHLVKFTNIQLGIYPSYMKGQRGIDAVNLKAMAEGVSAVNRWAVARAGCPKASHPAAALLFALWVARPGPRRTGGEYYLRATMRH